MARPQVAHDGFLVPNAKGLTYPRMAEVDQVDFNTLSNLKWSVVEGCLVTVSGSTATTAGGTAIVNGTMVTLSNSSAQIGIGAAQDRFDLVCVNESGALVVVSGTPSTDPTIPQPSTTQTALAAVFVPSGVSGLSDYVIDKRVFAVKALLTKVNTTSWLIRNKGDSNDQFTVRGDGQVVWSEDTFLRRVEAATLEVVSNLIASGSLSVGSTISAGGNISSLGQVAGSNLVPSNRAPTVSDTYPKGTLWQDGLNGRLFSQSSEGWVEVASITNAVPTGFVGYSVSTPDEMGPLGWICWDGRSIDEATYPAVFQLSQMQQFITGGLAPNRTMTLPDMTNRVLTGTKTNVGLVGSNEVTITIGNLPKHKHNVSIEPGGGHTPSGVVRKDGGHGHVQEAASGKHGHDVVDPGHAHNGMDAGGGNRVPIISVFWGGKNKLDALFNDRNHTYSVEPLNWTAPATTGISVSSNGSEHTHVFKPAPDHDHELDMDPVSAHPHVVSETEVGNNTPVNIQPAGLALYCYIRS